MFVQVTEEMSTFDNAFWHRIQPPRFHGRNGGFFILSRSYFEALDLGHASWAGVVGLCLAAC